MTHPLIQPITDLAAPIAESLGLQVVAVVFQTNYSPAVLRIDISNPLQDTGLQDCEAMSRALEAALDEVDLIPAAYVLEVSSPGVSSTLYTDREFHSFKGFDVVVHTSQPFSGKQVWMGKLVHRDEQAVHLNQKGRAIAIPRHLIATVQLQEQT